MRVVIQRVKEAKVLILGKVYAKTSFGILVFVGFKEGDCDKDIDFLVAKIMSLRMFADEFGVTSKSIVDIRGDIMLVSQFTLYGDCKKGRRPSFTKAMPADRAVGLYNTFVSKVGSYGLNVGTGQFQANMDVAFVNEGPFTLLLDTDKVF